MPRRTTPHVSTVLLVEDEPLVREVATDILHEAGFRVIEAATADEAFETLKHRSDVQAVFTDVDMPGSINGFEFARLVHQGWPDLAVVVSSGKMRPQAQDLPPKAVFLPKPFRPDTMVGQLRQLLRAGAPSPPAPSLDLVLTLAEPLAEYVLREGGPALDPGSAVLDALSEVVSMAQAAERSVGPALRDVMRHRAEDSPEAVDRDR
ncbi:MAG TPA: response regulator [Beijerinckiaceae bacterium]|jgi:CheY-like chemotaxis protein